METRISDTAQKNLKVIVDHFEAEDKAVRERQIRNWRKLKHFWNGIQRIWFSETAHDWKTVPQDTTNSEYYDKTVNVFRAYLESIIAALSVNVPAIKCSPDDAENPLDIATAQAGDKIAKLVSKHNDVVLLFIHALYIYCTEGLVCAYSYTHEDEKYGTYEVPEYNTTETTVPTAVCPNCQTPLVNDEVFQNYCPTCQIEVPEPEMIDKVVLTTDVDKVTQHPKSRQCIEVYGGLNVKIPVYARTQAEIPYLRYAYECHYSLILSEYPDLRDKFPTLDKIAETHESAVDSYERWGRLSTLYNGEYPRYTPTVRHMWLRPCAYEILDKEGTKELKKLFPTGCKVTYVNDTFAHACEENLDDYWTLSRNPVSDYLHHDPVGMLIVSIQEITNDIVSLVIQTMEHGIPQTFADPAVLDFQKYGQTEAAPGTIYPATPKSGARVGDSFYEVKTATLSAEILPLLEKIQEAGQLVSGALPSLFGGVSSESGSRTAAEYSMSRAQALQRLQTPWKMLTIWWKEIFAKVINAYIQNVEYDERVVQKEAGGQWINSFIRKAELTGKIGEIELEASEQLPTSWQQKRDIIMQLMQTNSPEVISALTDPANLGILSEVLGLDELKIPGSDDRIKQYEEIQQLLGSEPIAEPVMNQMTGQMQQQYAPSVDVEPLVDNHVVEATICREWLVSAAGRDAKINNPHGYMNVMLHMKRHMDLAQVAMAQNNATQVPPPAGPNNNAGQVGNNAGQSEYGGSSSSTVQ